MNRQLATGATTFVLPVHVVAAVTAVVPFVAALEPIMASEDNIITTPRWS